MAEFIKAALKTYLIHHCLICLGRKKEMDGNDGRARRTSALSCAAHTFWQGDIPSMMQALRMCEEIDAALAAANKASDGTSRVCSWNPNDFILLHMYLNGNYQHVPNNLLIGLI